MGNLIGSVLSADVVARYYRSKGEEVVMVSGSDEHGTPIEVESIRLNIPPLDLTNENHLKISKLFKKWGISYDNYTRTESPIHKKFVKEHLMKIYKKGYIFTQETKMLYCKNCNRYLPDRFIEGKCPYCEYIPARGDQCDRCGKLLEPINLIEPYCSICSGKPTIRNTKHWYIDLPKLSKNLKTYIENNENLPSNTKKFSLNFIKDGLKPRAVTRDINWGIQAPFPGAENKTIYVWVEAVLGYISATIEYFKNSLTPEKWREYWFDKNVKTLYFIGKDNIPFHTIILPALLIASGEDYNLPWSLSTTEFLQFKGKKASKSQRIGIWIDEALELFPPDYWRYFLISTRPETKDFDFSWKIFIEKVNSDLNDTLGNFIHRTLTFIKNKFNSKIPEPKNLDQKDKEVLQSIRDKIDIIENETESFKLQSAANNLIGMARIGNQYLNEREPWNLIKNEQGKAKNTLYIAAQIVKALTIVAANIMPFTAEKSWQMLKLEGIVHDQKWIKALEPLPKNHEIGEVQQLFRKIEGNGNKFDEILNNMRKDSVSK